MITREFEQEWDERISPINHNTECNVIFDMLNYISNLSSDLKEIKKTAFYEFSKIAKVSIDKYIEKFKDLQFKFHNICAKDYKNQGIMNFDMSYYRDDLTAKNGNHYKINDKYYKVLKRIANEIFKLEDDVKKVTDKLWENEITKIDSYDRNGKYFLLAHADYKTVKLENLSKEKAEYAQKQTGICFSAISNEKTKLYDQDKQFYRGIVGIIAKPKKDAIVGISMHDMISIEFCDGKCETPDQFFHSKVDKCYDDGKSQIYCTGTKICPPQAIFDTYADTINEIILDKNKIDVQAVFYVTDNMQQKPKRLNEYVAEQEKLAGRKLPVVQVTPKNKAGQYDLDRLFYDYY